MSGELAKALAAFQESLPHVGKGNTANTGTFSYQYADLADVAATVLPLLGKHGLSFSAKPTLDESGRFVLAYTLRHSSGESDSGAYPLPSSGSPQQIGSAITYARRYCLLSITGVAPGGEDDDGASAPPSDRRPVERHEHSYDPAEQEMLLAGFQAEIDAATTPEQIFEIGTRVRNAKEMSPATYDRLQRHAGKRRAELNGAGPATVTPTADTSTRRGRELAAMDQRVAKRKEAADAAP